ncbi:MAG: prepilin-type N-terminal cleavage/methylation domain-containing protein [Candidatus Omnitrophica bacterium]|nr:prepilin-type N-terminal cleavage/methylation domain-containing protein [Candidatus Omnitrophota bacterium]
MKKGFTLVEVLVSILLLCFIVGALIAVFTMGRNVYDSNEGMLDMQRIVRQSIEGMIRELRQSRAADIIIGGGGATISFIVPISVDPLTNSSSIQYYVDANNQLVREHPSGTLQVLAVNVDSLNFTLNGNMLDIVIQAAIDLRQQDLIFTVRERISLRS